MASRLSITLTVVPVYLPPPLLLLLGAAWLTNGGRNWPYSGRNGVTQTFVRRALDATRGQRRKGGRTAQCYFRSRRRSEGKVRACGFRLQKSFLTAQ